VEKRQRKGRNRKFHQDKIRGIRASIKDYKVRNNIYQSQSISQTQTKAKEWINDKES
jgi:hypothetical protein